MVLSVIVGTSLLTAAQLPSLTLDDLPLTVKATLQRVYDAARAKPEDAAVVGRLAMFLHAYDQHRAAGEYYSAARRLDRRSASWAYLSGVAQAELGDDRGAVTSFRDALDIDPRYLPARVRLADALMRAGELDASRREYSALVREFPELAVAHYGLGRLASASGDRQAAAEHYRRAVAIAPQFGPAHYALALAYRDLGLDDRTAPHLAAHRAYGASRPSLADPLLEQVRSLKETARDLIEEAARLGRAGKLEESIAAHHKALELDPSAAQAHVNLISLYGRTRRPDKAEEHYRAAVTLGANLADAHYNYGVLLAATGRPTEAAAAFRQALQVNPFHAQAHHNLGGMLAQRGKLDEAAMHYRQAIANDPQHRSARVNLGRVLVGLQRYAEAVEQFERALRLAEEMHETELAATIRKELQRLQRLTP